MIAGWMRNVGHVTPVPMRAGVVAAIAPMTDHTNGLLPWRSVHGWKWSEIMKSQNPASCAPCAKPTSSGAVNSSLESAYPILVMCLHCPVTCWLMPAAERHPHLREPRADGHVRVDFHSHTMWSGDCTTTPEELEEAIVDSGIDVLCITDHSTTNGAKELASRLACRVIVGEELRTGAG